MSFLILIVAEQKRDQPTLVRTLFHPPAHVRGHRPYLPRHSDETLCVITRELVRTVRAHVTIDWTWRENVRPNLRRLVKRILRKYGYPPDKQESATRTVIKQAEVLSAGWAV